jgi:putative MATE family efflux protein
MSEDKTKLSIVVLALPMFIENIVRTSLLVVDQLMLNRFSEKAAAAMSSVNQLAFFVQMVYLMVAAGISILVSQTLGAGRKEEAARASMAGMAIMAAFSILVSAAVALLARPVLGLYALEDEVRGMAARFLAIYGIGSFFMAMNMAQSNVLRAYGYAYDPMVINIVALAVTILGNAISLFGLFGLPVVGITGVALSNVAGQAVAFFLSALRIRARGEISIRWRELGDVPRNVYATILRIGVPTAGENLSYNSAQIFIVGIISRMGTEALAAYGIAISLSRYVFISGVSIGNAGQIKVGYFVGAGMPDEAYRGVWRWFFAGFAVSAVLILALNLVKAPILATFTGNERIIAIAAATILVGFILEPARNLNTVINPALKGSGDTVFPVAVGVCLQWGVGVTLAWLFGLRLGLGLPGVWLALSCDEWSRGIVSALRWRSGAWRKKALV